MKVASTVYRFARYYTGNAAYRRKGPPRLLLRMLGPALIVLTVALIGSGVGLGFTNGSTRDTMLFAHKASFVLWFGAMTVHVFGHLMETARVGPRDWRPVSAIAGVNLRRWLLAGSVAAGLLLGAWGLSFFGSWSQFGGRGTHRITRPARNAPRLDGRANAEPELPRRPIRRAGATRTCRLDQVGRAVPVWAARPARRPCLRRDPA